MIEQADVWSPIKVVKNKEVLVPRVLFRQLYLNWLENHGCYTEFCTCLEKMATCKKILEQP